jgi:predicted kinase
VPEVVIIAGPNGAGKTTFADEYLAATRRSFKFVNADEIALEVAVRGLLQPRADIRAARIMLDRINQLVAIGADFAFETTLATRTYAQKGSSVATIWIPGNAYLPASANRRILGRSCTAEGRSRRPWNPAADHSPALR